MKNCFCGKYQRQRGQMFVFLLILGAFFLSSVPAQAADGRKGDTVTDGTFTYIILTKATKKREGSVAVYGLNKNVFNDKDKDTENDSPKKLEIPEKIKYDNGYYQITATGSSGKATIAGDSSTYQYYWGNASKIILPDSLMVIGDNSFAKAEKLKTVKIPSGVTAIGGEAFSGTGLTKITIPPSVERIGRAAFWNCKSLKTVEFGKGLETIGKWAFQQSGITCALLPEGLLEIKQAAFSGCDALKKAAIPSTLEKLGAGVFSDCGVLKTLSVGRENQAYRAENNIIYSSDGTLLADAGAASGSIEVAEGTEIIETCAFESNTKITSVAMPDTVKTVRQGAFLGCTKLKKAVFGNGVEKLEASSFAKCTKLKAIALPDSVKRIGKNAFYLCSSAKMLTLGNSVSLIGSRAFAECETLSSVKIPGSLSHIGASAFYQDSSLAAVEFAEGAAGIGEQAFAYCSLRSVVLPESLVSIESAAFQGNRHLESVWIPAAATDISDNVFASCRKLTDLQVSEGNKAYLAEDGALYNKSRTKLIAWPGADGGLVLEDTLLTIGSYAFQGAGINSVVIPDSVLKIEEGAFASCEELLWVKFEGNEVLLPAKTEGEDGASAAVFYACFALQTVSAPEIEKGDGVQEAFAQRLKKHMDKNGVIAWLQKNS